MKRRPINIWQFATLAIVSLMCINAYNESLIAKTLKNEALQRKYRVSERVKAQVTSHNMNMKKEMNMSTPKLLLTRMRRAINEF